MVNIKDNRYYIDKIVADLDFIINHTKGITYEELSNNEVLQDSMMFRFIQIYENANKLTDEFKENHKEIPWHAISGMRNRIVHEYGVMDLHVIYDTLVRDIPDLKNIFEYI